ncbi:MAG: hormogonium polysaccharide biosynthesis glycosyltransferase HpsE [Cyanobacteria bacterium J06621_11]
MAQVSNVGVPAEVPAMHSQVQGKAQGKVQSKVQSQIQSGVQGKALDVTVAIPTYNGAARLPQLLDRLRSQTNTEAISWEVVVCDNGSTDDMKAVVTRYQADWPSHFPLRYRFVPEQGAAFARQYAVEGANSTLIAFLDDDNIPATDWVAQAHKFSQAHPQAGAFGSQIHGKFETELPEELQEIKCFLAIIERGKDAQRYEPASKMLPPAAGLVVRREAWLNAVPKRLFLNNKGKSAGLASEDLEAILYIQKSGCEIWYNPDMVVHHDIPDGRLRKDYLVTLFRCVGLSRYHIRLLGQPKWKHPLAIPAYIANDIRKLALHRMRFGARQQLNTVENCQRELLTSTLTGPFFLLNKAYKDQLQAIKDKRQGDQYKTLEKIARAFEQDHFTLYQQDVFELDNAADIAATDITGKTPSTAQKELLLRLSNDSGVLKPSEFLPTAQRYGLMRALDRQVVRSLLEHVDTRAAQPHFSQELAKLNGNPMYSLNLSQDSILDDTFIPFLSKELEQSTLSPSLFCFEIATSNAIAHPEKTLQFITQLKVLGCKITLDDFTLDKTTKAFLNRASINYIKLSADLLQTIDVQTNQVWKQLRELQQQSLVKIIIKGVESPALLKTINQQGIRYIQGYQMSYPEVL